MECWQPYKVEQKLYCTFKNGCKDMEDHANRKYWVKMPERLVSGFEDETSKKLPELL